MQTDRTHHSSEGLFQGWLLSQWHGLTWNAHWTYKEENNNNNLQCSLGNANVLLCWQHCLLHLLQPRYLHLHFLARGAVPFPSMHPLALQKCQQWCSTPTEHSFLLNDTARNKISVQLKEVAASSMLPMPSSHSMEKPLHAPGQPRGPGCILLHTFIPTRTRIQGRAAPVQRPHTRFPVS